MRKYSGGHSDDDDKILRRGAGAYTFFPGQIRPSRPVHSQLDEGQRSMMLCHLPYVERFCKGSRREHVKQKMNQLK